MTSHCADGNRGALAAADAQVQLGAVSIGPTPLSVMGADGVGRFDEGPLQLLVALAAHLAVVGLAP